MKRAILSFISAVTLSISIPAQALVVLQYHHVSENTPKATSISPKLFDQHLAYLREHNFEVIGLDKLAEMVRQNKSLPDKTAVITFDDGYISVYDNAWPMLKKYDFPFSIFINTEPHNNNNPQFMSWEQMQRMSEARVVFANHTVSHPHLVRRREGETKGEWRARVWREIATAEETIAERLGQNHKLLAYPFGEHNLALQGLLQEKKFLAFGQQSGPLAPYSDHQALPRFPFGGSYGDLDDFSTKVNTLPLPLSEIKITDGDGGILREPELPKDVDRPALIMSLADGSLAGRVSCFASGQGRIPVAQVGNQLHVRAPKPVPVGRSRYNCTAATGESGRFFWYSAMFIRRPKDGGWYSE